MKKVVWKFEGEVETEVIVDTDNFHKNFEHLFKDKVQEEFYVFWMDARNRVMGYEGVAKGTLSDVRTHSREVFRGAIVAGAHHIIIAHNHPGGNQLPSKSDDEITMALIFAGNIMKLPVMDHIIFYEDGYYSYHQNDRMKKLNYISKDLWTEKEGSETKKSPQKKKRSFKEIVSRLFNYFIGK